MEAVETSCMLEWKVSGFSMQSRMPSLVKERDSDEESAALQPPKKKPKKKAGALKVAAERSKRLAKACTAFNDISIKCTKNHKACPHKKAHVCSTCSVFGHPSYKCKKNRAGAAKTEGE